MAFSFGYLVLVAGLILVAAGLHVAVHEPGHHLTWRIALTMAVGTATYLVGNVFYLWRLGLGGRQWLLVTAVLSLLTTPLGHALGSTAQLTALVAVLVVSLFPQVRERASAQPRRDG